MEWYRTRCNLIWIPRKDRVTRTTRDLLWTYQDSSISKRKGCYLFTAYTASLPWPKREAVVLFASILNRLDNRMYVLSFSIKHIRFAEVLCNGISVSSGRISTTILRLSQYTTWAIHHSSVLGSGMMSLLHSALGIYFSERGRQLLWQTFLVFCIYHGLLIQLRTHQCPC